MTKTPVRNCPDGSGRLSRIVTGPQARLPIAEIRHGQRGQLVTSPSFDSRLGEAAACVHERLQRIFEDRAIRLGAPARLVAAMRHGALAGGKRFRPFLVMETAKLFGVAPHMSIETAAALECVHCYSLVHDDLPAMDNDDLRRGQPTVHKAFDDWTAVLAGDALLTLAFELLAEERAHPDPAVRARLVAELARASGDAGMVGGQCLDLEADKLGSPPAPDLLHVERLQSLKTGALIRFACRAGAVLGRAAPEHAKALERYGEALGWAFQISDDLLDVEGDPSKVGKAVAKDAAAGKATVVAVLGVHAARERLDAMEAAAIAALSPFGTAAEMLREGARFVSRRDR